MWSKEFLSGALVFLGLPRCVWQINEKELCLFPNQRNKLSIFYPLILDRPIENDCTQTLKKIFQDCNELEELDASKHCFSAQSDKDIYQFFLSMSQDLLGKQLIEHYARCLLCLVRFISLIVGYLAELHSKESFFEASTQIVMQARSLSDKFAHSCNLYLSLAPVYQVLTEKANQRIKIWVKILEVLKEEI